jgi:hypothetical protein
MTRAGAELRREAAEPMHAETRQLYACATTGIGRAQLKWMLIARGDPNYSSKTS